MNRKARRRAVKVGQRTSAAAPLSRRLAEHLRRAREELVAGRPVDAEASCRQALRKRPDHPDVLDLLGAALMDQGRVDAALDCFRRAAAPPGHAMAEYHMGRALKRLNRVEDAIASYRRALVLHPGLAQAHYHLGDALLAQDRTDEAAAAYGAALAYRPDDPRAYIRLGITLAAQNRFDEAVALIRRALALDPQSAAAYGNLGKTLIAQRRWEEAVPILRRAVELDPTLVEVYRHLGVALRRLGRLEEAVDAHRQALSLGVDGPETQLWLSALLRAVGRPDEGRAMLEAGVRRRPWVTIKYSGRDKPLAAVLRLIGIQNSNLIVGPDRDISIHPSHFELQNLIAKDRFTVHEFLVSDDNLTATAGLPDFDIVVNSIGDPDMESASLESAQRFIARQSLPHINAPQRVLRTSRDGICALLRNIDAAVAPKTCKFDSLPGDGPSFLAALERHGLTPPVLVRPIGSHSGEGLMRIDGAADWDRAGTGRPAGQAYITAFHDFCGSDGYYRKLRFLCIAGTLFAQHLLISDRWNVHIGARNAMMKDRPWMQDEERRFLGDHAGYVGKDVCRALDEIASRIGLDFFGIDGALLPDGRLLVFEANACMRVPAVRPRAEFAYRNEYTRRVIDAFERMVLDKIGTPRRQAPLTAPAVS